MNKRWLMALSLVGALPALSAPQVTDPDGLEKLAGRWQGNVVRNVRETSAGGTPSEGEGGSPVMIEWRLQGGGLEGTSRLGKASERWTLKSDSKALIYTWDDGDLVVSARSKPWKELPTWVLEAWPKGSFEVTWAFAFTQCVKKKDGSPCQIPQDLPQGVQESGHWLFGRMANRLVSAVVYRYPSGQTRILIEELTRE